MLLKEEILKIRAKLKESADLPLNNLERQHTDTIEYVVGEDDEYINQQSGGTSLRGRITASYEDLVTHFGEPFLTKFNAKTMRDVDTFAEWAIEFIEYDEDGDTFSEYAFIYDWRIDNPPNVESNTEWRVGGKTFGIDEKVRLVLQGKGKRKRDKYSNVG